MKKSFLLIIVAVMFCANQLCAQTSGAINGHEWVDLGLPSGTKWATCNVGANKPEQYGNYYAWGETTAKDVYTEDNSKTYGMYMPDISGDKQHDAATANWGKDWRMPTEEDFWELLIGDNCTWTWTTQNNVNGYKVTSKMNGNSIFLPAAGCRYGGDARNAGSDGGYWSSTPYTTGSAYPLVFEVGYRSMGWGDRGFGLPVRPVVAE